MRLDTINYSFKSIVKCNHISHNKLAFASHVKQIKPTENSPWPLTDKFFKVSNLEPNSIKTILYNFCENQTTSSRFWRVSVRNSPHEIYSKTGLQAALERELGVGYNGFLNEFYSGEGF